MSQTIVTKHYSIKKRNINHVKVTKPPQNILSQEGKVEQNVNTTSIPEVKKYSSNSHKNELSTAIDKKCKRKQSTLSSFFNTEFEELKSDKTETVDEESDCFSQQRESGDPETEISLKNRVESEINSLPRSPKRNLPSPLDEGTPSKRKHLEKSVSKKEAETVEKAKETARRKLQLNSLPRKSRIIDLSPKAVLASPKQNHLLHSEKNVASAKIAQTIKPKETARRKLQLDSLSNSLVSASPKKNILCSEESEDSQIDTQMIMKPKETVQRKLDLLLSKSNSVLSPAKLASASPKKNLLRTPDKLDALIAQSRSTLILSPKLDELRKNLQLFSKQTSNRKDTESSPYKKNVVIPSPKSSKKTSAMPSVVSCEQFDRLDQSDTFVLPVKYKVLSEFFRSMDALVGTLNNRKQKITFDNVKEGVQKITKRNFSEKHLGQIVTVFPSAYNLSREKASYTCKKNNSSGYQLVITPNLNTDEDNQKMSDAFLSMTPSLLISRTNEFDRNLLELARKHHQDFLTRINFAAVSVDSIKRWHPKFPVDSVPDVPVAQLPELPEMKIYTARDVLNKFKGSIQTKVERALQSVADETEKSSVTLELKEIRNPKPETSKKELKGICGDLLEKIRAKESAKLLKTMTQSPSETKRLAMLERLPKIVNILFLFFTSEHKAAIPIDAVVDKITHSCNSLSTPDEVKQHLKLIAEKFPDWLNFIQIPKGVYVKIDKTTNINEMLDKAGLH